MVGTQDQKVEKFHQVFHNVIWKIHFLMDLFFGDRKNYLEYNEDRRDKEQDRERIFVIMFLSLPPPSPSASRTFCTLLSLFLVTFLYLLFTTISHYVPTSPSYLLYQLSTHSMFNLFSLDKYVTIYPKCYETSKSGTQSYYMKRR